MCIWPNLPSRPRANWSRHLIHTPINSKPIAFLKFLFYFIKKDHNFAALFSTDSPFDLNPNLYQTAALRQWDTTTLSKHFPLESTYQLHRLFSQRHPSPSSPIHLHRVTSAGPPLVIPIVERPPNLLGTLCLQYTLLSPSKFANYSSRNGAVVTRRTRIEIFLGANPLGF